MDLTKERAAFYRGMLAALAVVRFYDQRVLFDAIVATVDVAELVAVACADGQMDLSGLARYNYGQGDDKGRQ